MGKNIGFVSTRFSGTDGVTLESSKWAEVLKYYGHDCYWFAGELDRNPARSFLVPQAHFKNEHNVWIDQQIWGKKKRNSDVTDAIHTLKSMLKIKLRQFVTQFDIDILIVQNALTIPMHVPLGAALTEFIAETQIPTIAHHHDFYWERTRYSVNAVGDFLRMAFPPNLHNIEHVVINSAAQEELALRTGISSIIIPNVIDFENPPVIDEDRTKRFRRYIGLKDDDVMFLQPTRVVQRKGIEHAIELIKALKNPCYKLVVSHEAGDEGLEYAKWLKHDAKNQGVDLRFLNMRINDPWNGKDEDESENQHNAKQGQDKKHHPQNPEHYTLLDIYPHADFITYPSLYEGFGNAFLEAIYFKKPLLINRYAIFVRDIEPQGFDLIVMDGYLSQKNVKQVRDLLQSKDKTKKMVDLNYRIASRHYSYSVLRKKLLYLLDNFFGVES